MDFGPSATDYATHRPGFPESFFTRISTLGWIAPGMRALDLGAGTGAMALELAARGLSVTALDRSSDMLSALSTRANKMNLSVRTIVGVAEAIAAPDRSFELITAAQCWWWFDPVQTIREVQRLLVPGGRLLIASFCYLTLPGTIAHASEQLVSKHNPSWSGAAWEHGIFPEQATQLGKAGFSDIETWSYDVDVAFTQEAWRGRMRACNGVAVSLPPDRVEAYDREHAELLAQQFPGELKIKHRVSAVSGVNQR